MPKPLCAVVSMWVDHSDGGNEFLFIGRVAVILRPSEMMLPLFYFIMLTQMWENARGIYLSHYPMAHSLVFVLVGIFGGKFRNFKAKFGLFYKLIHVLEIWPVFSILHPLPLQIRDKCPVVCYHCENRLTFGPIFYML